MAQIQELQDKVNSPMRDNFTILDQGAALERPTFLIKLPRFCPRSLPRCDSGLPRDTLNGTVITGNVCERPPAQEGLSSTILNKKRIGHHPLRD